MKRLVFLIFCLCELAYAGTYSGGSGTEESPYLIGNAGDWVELIETNSDWGANIILISDIDFEGAVLTGTVGINGTPFTGRLDGQGCQISNYIMDMPESYYTGLFGIIENGTVMNLYVSNANITGNSYVSIIAAKIVNSTIKNCSVSGELTGSSEIGGIAGLVDEGSEISSCISTANINDGTYAGGIAGTSNGKIIDSSYTGTITAFSTLGGIAGRNGDNGLIERCWAKGNIYSSGGNVGGITSLNYTTVSNCFAMVDIEITALKKDRAGGLVGWNNTRDSLIEKCYSTGKVNGGRYYICGFCGINDGIIENCLWDIESSQRDNDTAATGLVTEDMIKEDTYLAVGWDFTNETDNGTDEVWRMPYGQSSYPILSHQRDIPGDKVGRYGVDMADFGNLADWWLLANGSELADLIELSQYWLAGISE